MASDQITNFSWSFSVDSGFDYQVKLHLRKGSGDEANIPGVFQVSLTSQTSPRTEDLPASDSRIKKKDDVVPILSEKIKLTVKQSVATNSRNGKIVLNGVEVLKVCDTNQNPAEHDYESLLSYSTGPSYMQSATDVPSVYLSTPEPSSPTRSLSNDPPVPPTSRCNTPQRTSTTTSPFSPRYELSSVGSISSSPHRLSTLRSLFSSPRGSSRSRNQCCIFTLEEIKIATNNFDSALLIGRGGFGNVYRGELFDGLTKAAIKRWNPIVSRQGMNEFRSEIEKLSAVRHHNLVQLIGYCEGNREMILVYEYMPQGTLRDHLYGDRPPLPWLKRLRICIGAARGLHYLHTSTEQGIIHRDVKPSNILLDENLDAKISDFGLARIGSDRSLSYVSTEIKGSKPYIDPDYSTSNHLTKKSDVYSLGVVLFEVLSGKLPTDPLLSNQHPMQPLSLARPSFKKGNLDRFIDTKLKPQIELKCLGKFSKTVIDCLSLDHTRRPSMGEVLLDLEHALEKQEKSQKKVVLGMHTPRF